MFGSASFIADPDRGPHSGIGCSGGKVLLFPASAGATEIQSVRFDRLKRELDGLRHFQFKHPTSRGATTRLAVRLRYMGSVYILDVTCFNVDALCYEIYNSQKCETLHIIIKEKQNI